MSLKSVTDIQLIGAKQAAALLGINTNKVYILWNTGALVWWNIGGTKKTTREAISKFLLESQGKDLHI